MAARTIVVLMFLAVGFSSAKAQQVDAPNKFSSMRECEVAFRSGNYQVYIPTNRSGYGKNPVNNRTIIRAPLPQNACVHEITDVGWRYVVQLQGTEYRWKVGPSGGRTILAQDECGNDANEVLFLGVGPIVSPAGVTKGDKGDKGDPGARGSPGARGDRGPRGYDGRDFSWKPVAVATGIAAGVGGIWALVKWWNDSRHHDKPAPPPPGVASDSTKVTCTGTPCTGRPLRAPSNSPGLMLDPVGRSVGWRFSFPRR